MVDIPQNRVPPSQEVLREILRREFGVDVPETSRVHELRLSSLKDPAEIERIMREFGISGYDVKALIQMAEGVNALVRRLSPPARKVFLHLFTALPYLTRDDLFELAGVLCGTFGGRNGPGALYEFMRAVHESVLDQMNLAKGYDDDDEARG